MHSDLPTYKFVAYYYVLCAGVSYYVSFVEMVQQNSLALTGVMAYSCGVYCRVCPSLFVGVNPQRELFSGGLAMRPSTLFHYYRTKLIMSGWRIPAKQFSGSLVCSEFK